MQSERAVSQDDSFDLIDWLSTLWQGRWWIVLFTGVFGACGLAYALSAEEWFRAEVVMVRAEDSGLRGGLGQIGGLASLAGIDLGGGDSASQTPLAVLGSREFAREFIQQKELLEVLLPRKKDDTRPPDLRDAVEYFRTRVCTISEDKKTGLVTLAVTWRDPVAGAEWANDLVRRSNARLRERALNEATRNVKYLQDEMSATNVASLQQSLGRVLESEMQKLLLARGRDEFAFKVIDPAFVPKRRVAPQRFVILAASVLLGLVVSVVVVTARSALRDRRLRAETGGGR